ncbi:Zn-ribbon domain-containing OB-fold protein [Massilia cavernae]|uniref:DNA-binding protein n=1 Tax=Massilia cavernae TaxID=2320864 RepID=A0A418Y0R2_9BURK|nr:zinc ribbon domain-containing protein [Massilia cavernae]RJG18836.1 DNA-binding protein [Massilia cavernae]
MSGLGADGEYWKALAQGKVKMQQCAGCEKWNWPAVWRCGDCGSWEHAWREVAPAGRIFSWTRTWHEFGAPAAFGLPYVSVVVELDGAGGRRLIGTMHDGAAALKIGQHVTGEPVQLEWEGQAMSALRWKLTGEAAGATSASEGKTA